MVCKLYFSFKKEEKQGGREKGSEEVRKGEGEALASGPCLAVALKPRHESPGCVSITAPQGGPAFSWPMSSFLSQFCRLQKL